MAYNNHRRDGEPVHGAERVQGPWQGLTTSRKVHGTEIQHQQSHCDHKRGNVTYTIPSGSLKIPITGAGAQAYGALTVNVELDLSFKTSEILNPTLTLNPVATAKVT